MATIEDFLALSKHSKPVGNGVYIGSCIHPNHPDSTPSMTMKAVVNDKGYDDVLVHCFAGCPSTELFDIVNKKPLSNPTIAKKILEKLAAGESYTNDSIKEEKRIVKLYNYLDLEGNLRYQKVRYEPKSFSYRQPATKSEHEKYGLDWKYSMKGVEWLLYMLSEIHTLKDKSCPIVIDESEKNVEFLWEQDIPATNPPNTNINSCWNPDWNDYFINKDIVVFPHHDTKGRKFTLDLFLTLRDSCNSFKIVNLPQLLDKEDIVDWYQNHKGDTDQLWVLIDAAVDVKNSSFAEVETLINAGQIPEIEVQSTQSQTEESSEIDTIPLISDEEYLASFCSICLGTGFQSRLRNGVLVVQADFHDGDEFPQLIICNHQTFDSSLKVSKDEVIEDIGEIDESKLGF